MKRIVGLLLILVFAPVASATEPVGQVVRDMWYESRTEQGKLGYLHLESRAVEQDGRKLVRTVVREELKFLRSGDPYHEDLEHDTLETEAGAVIELGYKSNLSKKQHLVMRGRVQGKELPMRVYSDGQPTQFMQTIAWAPDALGLYAGDRFFEGKKLARGDRFTITQFMVSVNRVVPSTFTVKGHAETSLGKGRRQLLKLEQTFPKEFYLSTSVYWLDEKGIIVKMDEDTPTFGLVSYELTSRETAQATYKPTVADVESPIAVNTPLKLSKGLPKELVVRVRMEGEDEPGTLFVPEPRQKVLKADKETAELRLLGKGTKEDVKLNGVADEYLQSNFFIRSDDPLVQKLAREAVKDVKDKRKQVRLVRDWIREKVDGNYEVPFATADEVARTLEGDCTEMGVLSAAMYRALGIPSRVAFGIVYDPDPNHAGFGGHLWTEVFLDGHWEPCDSAGVIDLLGAAYIKIADFSMKDVLNPDELVAVRRAFAGKMKIDILETK